MLRKLRNGEDIFALLREDGEKQLLQEPIVIDLRSQNKEHLSFQPYDDVTDVEGDDDEEDLYDGGVNTDLPSSTFYDHHYTMSGSTTKNSQVWTSPTPQEQQQEPAHQMNSGSKHCPYTRSDVASTTTSAMEYFNQNSHTLFKVSPFTFSHCTTSTYHVPTASTGFLPQTPISDIYSHSSSFTSHTTDFKDQHGSNSYSNRKKGPRNYTGNSFFNNDILLSSAAKILVEMSSPPSVPRASEFKIGSALDQETGRNFTPLRGSFSLATNNIQPTQTPSDRIVSL
jgi:hypothetical protein